MGRGKEVSLGIDVSASHCYIMEKEIIEKKKKTFSILLQISKSLTTMCLFLQR